MLFCTLAANSLQQGSPSPSQLRNRSGTDSSSIFMASSVCFSLKVLEWWSHNHCSSAKQRMYRQRYPHFLLAVARQSSVEGMSRVWPLMHER